MTGAKDYERRVRELVPREGLRFNISSIPEAKQTLAEIRQVQKELRFIKREINTIMKSIRASYASQSADAGSGDGALALRILGGREPHVNIKQTQNANCGLAVTMSCALTNSLNT